LGNSSATYIILNPHVPLLDSHLYYYLKVYRIFILGQFSVFNIILNKATPLLALNLYRQLISSIKKTIFLMQPSKPHLFQLNYLIMDYLRFICFTTYLVSFIDSIKNISLLLKLYTMFNYLVSIKVVII